MALETFTGGHRSQPWFVAAGKELFGLCGAAMLHSRDLLQRVSTVVSTGSRMQETQKTFPCHLQQPGRMGWALWVPRWTQLSSWALNLNLSHLFGSSDQWWADHILSTPRGSSGMGRGSCCLFCCSEVRALTFSIAAVLLALHQLAPNPSAWQFTREGKETWPESMRKAEIMDFRGGSPLSDLQFHAGCQDSHVLTCVYIKRKPKRRNRFFFFFAYNPTEWRIFLNLTTKAFSFCFKLHFLMLYLSSEGCPHPPPSNFYL